MKQEKSPGFSTGNPKLAQLTISGDIDSKGRSGVASRPLTPAAKVTPNKSGRDGSVETSGSPEIEEINFDDDLEETSAGPTDVALPTTDNNKNEERWGWGWFGAGSASTADDAPGIDEGEGEGGGSDENVKLTIESKNIAAGKRGKFVADEKGDGKKKETGATDGGQRKEKGGVRAKVTTGGEKAVKTKTKVLTQR